MLAAALRFFRSRWQGVTRADFYRTGRYFLMVNGVLALAAFAYLHQPYRLAYNNTWSMAKGFWYYNVEDQGELKRGDTVAVRFKAPDWLLDRSWFDHRHTALIKRVGAVPGDHIQVNNGVIRNCGDSPDGPCDIIAERLAWDTSYKPLHFVPLPDVVPPRSYFLTGDNPGSLDSRYMGLFTDDAVKGRASQLYTRQIPEAARQLAKEQVPAKNLGDVDATPAQIPGDQPRSPNHWRHYNRQGHVITGRSSAARDAADG